MVRNAMAMMTVGILALQGAFAKHEEMLKSLGICTLQVRKPKDLTQCQGLIIPGGESTAISKQINFIGMADEIREFAKQKPIFGTCAGLILMAKKIIADPIIPFGFLDIEVERNAFGRQAESFQTEIEVALEPKKNKTFQGIFIRAPRICTCSSKVTILSKYKDEPVLVQQSFHLGAVFHPELTCDSSIHEYFLRMVMQVAGR
jgi:pyridoxal 5'-phosphate synthase pdxT subunit